MSCSSTEMLTLCGRIKNHDFWKMSVSNQPNMFGMLWILKVVDFLPLYGPYKKPQYDGQTKTLDSFRLLLVEVLHGSKVFKNEEYEEVLFGGNQRSPTKD